jgi:NAD(P)-dependent dehydrogenase (short-subunit alcohol dehydrogenase family)
MPFEGTTAVVTGGAMGLGLAITEALATRGTRVAIFDVATDEIDAQVARLRDAGAKVNGYQVDVSDRAQVASAVAQVRADLGPVLMLVNNAGIEQFGRFAEISDEQWDRVMAVNLRGPFICTQVVLPDMVDAKWGRIVNISSSSAQGGQSWMAAYVSSKAGVIGLTKSLALELGPKGITVNTIPPGMVVTPMLETAIAEGRFTASLEHFASITPVRRAGRPEDVANAAVFLCQDESSYITGQVIGVNGGRRT